ATDARSRRWEGMGAELSRWFDDFHPTLFAPSGRAAGGLRGAPWRHIPLRRTENGLNLRNRAMSPEHDTDPNAVPPTSGNTTDPTFPPKLGKQGPKAVKVTAVQGPGIEPKEITTTERLLTGLLDGGKPEIPPRKRASSGDDAAAYSASPRPVPVAHKEEE